MLIIRNFLIIAEVMVICNETFCHVAVFDFSTRNSYNKQRENWLFVVSVLEAFTFREWPQLSN